MSDASKARVGETLSRERSRHVNPRTRPTAQTVTPPRSTVRTCAGAAATGAAAGGGASSCGCSTSGSTRAFFRTASSSDMVAVVRASVYFFYFLFFLNSCWAEQFASFLSIVKACYCFACCCCNSDCRTRATAPAYAERHSHQAQAPRSLLEPPPTHAGVSACSCRRTSTVYGGSGHGDGFATEHGARWLARRAGGGQRVHPQPSRRPGATQREAAGGRGAVLARVSHARRRRASAPGGEPFNRRVAGPG